MALLDIIRGISRREAVTEIGHASEEGIGLDNQVVSLDRGREERRRRQFRRLSPYQLLAAFPVVAASVRYAQSLVSSVEWSIQPVDDSDAAMQAAETAHDMTIGSSVSPWPIMVRRVASYLYWGYGVHEWTARREGSMLVLDDIEPRPQDTIDRWQIDEDGTVIGVWQSGNATPDVMIPRAKFLYVRDDSLSDHPEGLGWYDHLTDLADRYCQYIALEAMGLQRDLSAVPIGRAPLTELKRLAANGTMTKADATNAVDGLRDFVTMQVKSPNTGIIIDSEPYRTVDQDGRQPTGTPQWDVSLMQGSSATITAVAAAIDRLNHEAARIIGTDTILLGSDGSGSLALGRDKTSQFYLVVDSAVRQIAASMTRDVLAPLWLLNGQNIELMPSFTASDISQQTSRDIAATLRDLATAGSPLAIDDPAVNEIRRMMGLSDTETSDAG